HAPLEEARAARVVDAGDHRDPDGVAGGPDLTGGRRLLLGPGARRRRDDGPDEPERGSQDDPTRSVHGAPLDRPRPVRVFVSKIAHLVTGPVTRSAVQAFHERSPGEPGGHSRGRRTGGRWSSTSSSIRWSTPR